MNEIGIKPKKEINRTLIIRAIFYYFFFNLSVLIICVTTGSVLLTFKHIAVLSILFIPLSIFCALAVEKLGSGFGRILSGWTSKKISPREQLSADLEIARHSKSSSRFEEALNIINGVLDKDKNFPDALYLKGQILWEGFGRSAESKKLFRRVMQLVPAEEPLHRWSSSYIDKITANDKLRVDEFMSDKEKS